MTNAARVVALVVAAAAAGVACTRQAATSAPSPVERGRYLVTIGGCNDCHTPLKMGAAGPEPDFQRLLSGHPSGMQLPPPPALGGAWLAAGSATMTAWAGPWGISYSANLTPDMETGIGAWEEAMFIQAMRTGKHLGGGRDILPPMPWQGLGKAGDEDLRAIFAYLKSIPAIKNQVPDPAPPSAPAS
jgi:mono/diheme cytochrome c family protein